MQDKDKIRQMAKTKIERLKEELCQQKDREDRLRSQINRRLKQKTDDFEKLYLEHKQTEADYKRLGLEFDRQQEKLKEVRTELTRKGEALAEEQTKAATANMFEEVANEKMELNKKHYEEVECAKLVLDKIQTTYQHQVIEYEGQAHAAAAVIQRLKNEKQATEDSAKLGVERIKSMMMAWRNRT